MTTHISERRSSQRNAAAYPVVIHNRKGRLLAQGRTADISENGIFMIGQSMDQLSQSEKVVVAVTIPAISAGAARRGGTRTILYSCRIARRVNLGQLVGLGLEFVEKLE